MLSNYKTTQRNNLRDVCKTFTDGRCDVYSATERLLVKLKGSFFFANESVGYAHYWEAYNNNVSIDRSISIPANNITIDTQDIVRIDNDYYHVSRIQFHDNKKPNYLTLSLTKEQFSMEVSI